MTRLLILAVVIGLFLPDVAALLRPLLYPSLFAIMVFTLIQIDLLSLRRSLGGNSVRVVTLFVIQMIVVPVVIGLIFRVASPDPVFALPVLMVTAAGSMFGTPAIAVLLGYTGRFTLLGVLVSTALLPFSLPLVWLAYSGQMLQMELLTYFVRLITFIGIPSLLAWMYRRLKHAGFDLPAEESMSVGALVGLVVFAIAIMDGVTARLIDQPELVIELILLAFVLHFGLFGLSVVCSNFIDAATALESGLLSSFRNIGLIIAISGPYLPEHFFLFAGVWQIPMYIAPWLYQRFLSSPPLKT